ncbi:glycosyl hydrolase-related protein [Nonomuraea dietziae]
MEAIKLADDRSGDVIVRLYESLGGQAATVVRPAFPVASVVETDLLERPIAEVAHDGGNVSLRLRAFQIHTLRFRTATSNDTSPTAKPAAKASSRSPGHRT